jgi:stage V sporulation protein SpoVS
MVARRRVLKVGAASIPKKVAGCIELVTRAGGPPALLPLGDPAVNQAAKAVALARAYAPFSPHHGQG